MFTDNTMRLLIAGALLLHGVAHAIALGALLLQGLGGASATRLTARSWLFPSLQTKSAALLALPFWAVSTLGFLAASLSYWGFEAVPFDLQRLEVTGGAVGLVPDVMQSVNTGNTTTETGAAQVALSATGTLVYVARESPGSGVSAHVG